MTDTQIFGAVDIGASSGRVMLAEVGTDTLKLTEVHRFQNGVTEIDGEYFWNFDALFAEVEIGLRKLGFTAESLGKPVVSIGIDTWAVDFGVIDYSGELMRQPRAYRDPRHERGVLLVDAAIERAEQYANNGLQFLPFNSLYQLALFKNEEPVKLAATKHFLLIPDLIAFKLTGQARTEVTNASTTGLFDPKSAGWNWDLISRLDLPKHIFADLISPGDAYGTLTPNDFGAALEQTVVLATGSHDTASAVAAVPATDENFAYVSSGTWSLVGLELDTFEFSEEARLAGFTNEYGVDNTNRFLKNVSGLWLLQESMRVWAEDGSKQNIVDLLEAAQGVPPQAFFNVNDPRFMAPGNMPERIQNYCKEHGLTVPYSKAEITRSIIDSLSKSYAETIQAAISLTGKHVTRIHIVGGGSQNVLLCQQTADASGLEVLSGPVEATALGNVLVQARAAEVVSGNLAELRSLITETQDIRSYRPRS